MDDRAVAPGAEAPYLTRASVSKSSSGVSFRSYRRTEMVKAHIVTNTDWSGDLANAITRTLDDAQVIEFNESWMETYQHSLEEDYDFRQEMMSWRGKARMGAAYVDLVGRVLGLRLWREDETWRQALLRDDNLLFATLTFRSKELVAKNKKHSEYKVGSQRVNKAMEQFTGSIKKYANAYFFAEEGTGIDDRRHVHGLIRISPNYTAGHATMFMASHWLDKNGFCRFEKVKAVDKGVAYVVKYIVKGTEDGNFWAKSYKG